MNKSISFLFLFFLFLIPHIYSQEENRYYLNYYVLQNEISYSGGCDHGNTKSFYNDWVFASASIKLADGLSINNKPDFFRTSIIIGVSGSDNDNHKDSPPFTPGTYNYIASVQESHTHGVIDACTRTYKRQIWVIVDDPIVIKSVYFIDNNGIKKDKNISCVSDNYSIRVITEQYRNNSKYSNILQIKDRNGNWQTLSDYTPSQYGSTFDFTWAQLSAYVDYGQAIQFRTRKQLIDNNYSTSTSTNYLYYYPDFVLDGDIVAESPLCNGDSPKIKIPSTTTGDFIITIKGNNASSQVFNYSTQSGVEHSGGYYIITNQTPDVNNNYHTLPLGVTYSIIIEHKSCQGKNTPCAYKGSFTLNRAPQYTLSDYITYQTNITENTITYHISQPGGTGRVNCIVDSSITEGVYIVCGSIRTYATLSRFLYANGRWYYRGNASIDLPEGTHSIHAENAYCFSNSQSAILDAPDPISFNPVSTNISCNTSAIFGDKSDGTITLNNLSGGIGEYSFNPSASLVGGNYVISGLGYDPSGHNITVSDGYGNSTTINKLVDQNSAVTCGFIDQVAPTMHCSDNGLATITNTTGGTAPYFFSRINREEYFGTNNVLEGFPSGSQPVYIMDNHDCIYSYPVVIPDAPPAMAIASDSISPPVCFGNDNGSYKAIITNILGTFWATSSDPRVFASNIDVSGDTVSVKNLAAGIYSIDVRDTYNSLFCDTTFYFEVPEKPTLSILADVTPVKGKGTATGSIGLEISGGNAGLSSIYLFDNASHLIDSVITSGNIATFDNLTGQYPSGGKPYFIDISDSKSCRYTVDNGQYFQFRIREPKDTLNIILALVSGISCFGEADAVVKTLPSGGWGSYQFAHSKPESFIGDSIFENIAKGQQYFYVIDSMGAIDSAYILIHMPEGLASEIAGIDSVKCYGTSTGAVHFTLSGGTPPYRNAVLGLPQNWQSGNIATGLPVGDFTFVFTDTNNCSTHDTLTSYIPEPDTLDFDNIVVNQSTCDTNNGSIGVELKGGTLPYSYNWTDYFGNPVGAGPHIENLEQSGYYYLDVTDKNGCTQHFEQAINPSDGPSITGVETFPVICYGQSNGKAKIMQVIPATPYAPWWLNWSNGSTVDSASGFPAGLHYVSVSDTNHCIFTNYFRILQPDSLWTSLSAYKDAHCFGYNDGFLQVQPHGGVGGYGYSWTNGDKTPLTDSLYVGKYTVTLSDSNQCRNSHTFAISQPDRVVVDLGEDLTICPGNKITIDGQDFTTYKWSISGNVISDERFLSINSENEYYLEVTNDSGCFAYDTLLVTVGNDALKADFLMSSAATYGDTLYIFELSNMELDSLKWAFDNKAFKDITDNQAADYVLQLENSDTGIFNVKLFAYSGGCIAQAIKQVEIMYENDSTDDYYDLGYKNPLITSIIVSPNPNEGTFEVKVGLREESDIRLVVFSVSFGKIVDDRMEYGLQDYELNYNLNNLDTGAYIIILTAGNERKQVKMIIL